MGLFNRNKAAPASPAVLLQIPDELAQSAQAAYGGANFVHAAELYANAVDKLHTMYVIGECKYRQPSLADATITEGLMSAVGAAQAMDPNVQVRPLVEQSIGYLGEIMQLPQARPAANIYGAAIKGLSRTIS